MYSLQAKLMHWIMGIMIIGMIVIGFSFDMIPPENKLFFYSIHKSFGLLLLGLVVIRFSMRFFSHYPAMPENTDKRLIFLAKANVFALYFMMCLMPSSGLFMSTFGGRSVKFFNLFEIKELTVNQNLSQFFHEIHEIGGFIFAFIILLHIFGGLFHHFILKDNILKRML